ncbi:MAG: 16S rRNA (cytosine(1402)-N(4))-methyltransferase RsmH [Oscillospiraceae bacterium]|nr:16S rRNA (cytosine(1402)-N(4))-methyltransferase RsmH [Oscillospiraceae bacterium]
MGEFQHIPVLLEECMEGLALRPNGIYVDGTVGGAGHSLKIAESLGPQGRLIALDKDPDAVITASGRLSAFPQAQVVQSDFSGLCEVLDTLGIALVDGILLDLGVSSYQLDTPERGFSYHQDAPLDMRMTKQGKSARDIVNTYDFDSLCRIMREYGEEKFAPAIAKAILRAREKEPIQRTGTLVDLIREAIPAKARRTGGHPAKRVFQALRIEVNGELESLSQFLERAFDRLKPGGRIAVITFQSLEDRMVKQKFAALCKGCTCPPDFPVCVCGNKPKARLVFRKSVQAGPEELEHNSRSKSARLRAIEKLEEMA